MCIRDRALCFLALSIGMSNAKAQVPKIILDADMSSDHDDIGAIATLHALADLGECQILGMMVSSLNGSTPLCMDAINTYYGRPNIPIGVRPDIGGIGSRVLLGKSFLHHVRDARALRVAVDHQFVVAVRGHRRFQIVHPGCKRVIGGEVEKAGSVSYTHLTLPTIYSV